MTKIISVGNRLVGPGCPVFIIAEIGINHNGDIEVAKKLIDAAVYAGCDAVKFQKRTPELCVPHNQRNIMRETPWGTMPYIKYRSRVEFGQTEYEEIDRYCRIKGIYWFASCWDKPSVDFVRSFSPICYKIASASLNDDALLKHINALKIPVILSTGMSTMPEIRHAVSLLDMERLLLAHNTSSYPCKAEEINLRMMHTLAQQFDCLVGYSGHEVGLQVSLAAVAMGACFIERHITLDRAMWGTDQAASVEPQGFIRLVRDIRIIQKALGDGRKHIYETEKAMRIKLRRKIKQ